MRIFKTGQGVPPPFGANMIHCWTADEAYGGDALRDMCGTANLTANGTSSVGVASPLGGAAVGRGLRRMVASLAQRFNGGAYTTDVAALSAASSVFACFRTNGVGSVRHLLNYSGAAAGTLVLGIYMDANNQLNVTFENAAGTVATLTFGYLFMPGSWHNIEVTCTAGTTVSLSINGALSETLTTALLPTNTVNAQQWNVGCDRTGSANYFDGDICHISVFNTALSSVLVENYLKRMAGFGFESASYARVYVATGDTSFKQFPVAGSTYLRGLTGHAMSTDTRRQKCLVFGGKENAAGLFSAETWEWDGHGWRNISPVISPSARAGAVLVYDPVRDRHVLFGGEDSGGTANAETWEFNPSTRRWSQITPGASPSARAWAAGTWDPILSKVYIYGGNSGATVRNDLLSYEGTTWTTETTGTGPSARTGVVLICRVIGGASRVFSFGGWDGTNVRNDMWQFTSGVGWTAVSYAAGNIPPSPRAYTCGMFWHPESSFVFMGGNDHSVNYSAEIWHYNPATTTWVNRTPGSGAPVALAKATLVPQLWPRYRALLVGGENTSTTEPTSFMWEWDGAAWVDVTPTNRLHNLSAMPIGDGTDADLLSSVEGDENNDSRMAQLTVEAWRDLGALSLAKFNDNVWGYTPMPSGQGIGTYSSGTYGSRDLIDTMRQVVSDVASVPAGLYPTGADWAFIFDGFITEYNWPTPSQAVMQCLDKGLLLMQCWMKGDPTYDAVNGIQMVANKRDPSYPKAESIYYNSVGGGRKPATAGWNAATFSGNLEGILQDILDDAYKAWGLPQPVTLYVPRSPNTQYVQKQQSRAKVLPILNDDWAWPIGWIVCYRWDDLTDTFRLTFFEPERQIATRKTPAAFMLEPRDCLPPQDIGVAISDNINELTVTYNPTSTINGVTGTEPTQPNPWPPAGCADAGWEAPDPSTGIGTAYVTVRADSPLVNGGNQSIQQKGLLSAEIASGQSSAIRTYQQAVALAVAGVCDLSLPIVNMSMDVLVFMPGVMAGDLGKLRGYPKNIPGAAWTDDLLLGMFASKWRVDRKGGRSSFQFRGGAPAGQRRVWHSKIAANHGDPAVRDGSSRSSGFNQSGMQRLVGALQDRTTYGLESAQGSVRNRDFMQTGGAHAPPDTWRVIGGVWGQHVVAETVTVLSKAKAIRIK